MKKQLLLLSFILCALVGISQTPNGLPSPNSTGFAKYNFVKNDSAGIAALRDTSWSPRYAGSWVYWQNAGVDSSFWVFNGKTTGRKWGKVVMVTSTGTGYVMYSDTSAMLSPYLRKYDTTAMLSKYLRTYDTTAMLAGYIRDSKIGVTVQPYNANTTLLGNTTTGSGGIIVLSGSPTLTLPSFTGVQVSGGIAAMPTGSGTLAYTRDTGRTVSAFATGGSLNKVKDSLVGLIAAGGFGTVLNVSTTDGVGIVSSVANPTSTPNISIRVDTGRATAQIVSGGTLKKVTDSLGLVVSTADALKLNISDTAAMLTPNYRRTITKITNSDLVNSTISGTALGSNLPALSFGTYLQSGALSYNGTTANTITTNATSSNLGSTLVARDLNGDFAARNISASLVGNASSASTVSVTNDNTTNATMYPLWSAASSGNNSPKVSSSKITFNPNTGVLTSNFTGALTGNATTASTLQTPRTINGVAFDGSADISISASVDSSLSAGYGITGSPFDGSLGRTWVVDTTKIIPYTDTLASYGIASKSFVRSFGYGTGSVTSVATNTGSGITGGTITTTGTIAADTVILATRPRVQKGIDSVAALIPSVSGYKLISDTLFNGGYTTRNTTKKIADSLSVVTSTGLSTKVNISDTASMLTNYRTGIIALNADTATLAARFTNQTNLANSKLSISDTATMLSGYKTYYPRASLSAGTGISYNSSTGVITNSSPSTGGTVTSVATNNGSGITGGTITGSGTIAADTTVLSTKANVTALLLGKGVGSVTSVAASAGTGISVSGSPITSSGTITITNTAPDQTVSLTGGTGISTSGTYPNFTITNTSPSSGGTVTSVATNTGSGITGGIITGTGTIAADTTVLSTKANVTALLLGKLGLTGGSTITTVGTLSSGSIPYSLLTGTPSLNYLPLSGGTLTGALTGTSASFANDITAYSVGLNGSAGGWARHYSFIGSTGTNRGGFGAFGSDNSLSYYYIGNAYNDNDLQIDASTGVATFSNSAISPLFYKNYITGGTGGSPIWEQILGYGASNTSYGQLQFGNEYGSTFNTSFRISLYSSGVVNYPLTISSNGAATFSSSVTASSFIKSGGTSSQFLMADGSTSTLSGSYVPYTGATTDVALATRSLSFTTGNITSGGYVSLTSGSANNIMQSNFNQLSNSSDGTYTAQSTTQFRWGRTNSVAHYTDLQSRNWTTTDNTIYLQNKSYTVADSAYTDANSYSPTFTNTTNVSSTTISNASYSRVGNIVTVSIGCSFTPTANSTNTVITFTLPVTTATGTQVYVGHGTNFGNGASSLSSAGVVNIASTTTGNFTFYSTSTSTSNANFTFQYKIN